MQHFSEKPKLRRSAYGQGRSSLLGNGGQHNVSSSPDRRLPRSLPS